MMNYQNQLARYKKVLLIDDDQVDLFISGKIMKAAYFAEEIVTKLSANDALDYLKSLIPTPGNLPDMIFLDLKMPGKNGLDFLREFGLISKGVKLVCKIIVLTNAIDPDPEIMKNIKSSPFIKKILYKPLTVEALEKI